MGLRTRSCDVETMRKDESDDDLNVGDASGDGSDVEEGAVLTWKKEQRTIRRSRPMPMTYYHATHHAQGAPTPAARLATAAMHCVVILYIVLITYQVTKGAHGAS